MVIQDALLVAFHVQPLVVDTFTGLPAPAVATTDSLVGVMLNAQDVAVPAP